MLIGFYPADLVIVKSKAASRIEEALPNLDVIQNLVGLMSSMGTTTIAPFADFRLI